ncbi:mechanosensitive ion channel [bacterium SCSIO 12741]|nr:mechanosensitive ion channel [bacterium SCSIO 12741]
MLSNIWYSPILLLILVFSLVGSTNLAAETKTDTIQGEAVESVSTSNITVQTEQTLSRMNQISENLIQNHKVDALEKKLSKAQSRVEDLERETNSRINDEIGVHYLNDIRIKWDGEEKKLRSIEGDISEVVAQLDEYRAELEMEKFRWNLTIDQLRDEKAAPSLIKSSAELVKEIKKTIRTLRDTGNSAMDLLSQVGAIKQQVSKNQDLVISTAQQEQSRIFEKTRPNLLTEILNPEKDSVGVQSQFRLIWEYSARDAVRFVKKKKNTVIGQILLLVLLIAIFFFVQARYKSWRVFKDESLRTTLTFIESPLATALFIAMFCTFWIYPGLPSTLAEFNTLMLTLVMMVILPKIVNRVIHPLMYMYAAAFLLLQIETLLVGHGYVQRLLTFTSNVLILVGMGVFYFKNRQSIRQYLKNKPSYRWISLFLWISAFHILIALVANALGYVALSDFLTRATVRSFVIGVLLFVSERIVQGILTIMLQSTWANYSYVINKRRADIHRWILGAYGLVAIYLWVGVVLHQFGISEDIGAFFKGLKEETWVFGSVEFTLSNVFDFVLVLVICWYLSIIVKTILEEEILSRLRLKRGVPMAIAIVTRYSILTFGFFLAVAAAGLNLEKLSFVAGALGVGIGFGLQNLVGNFVSGMILIFEKPIMIGDVIVVGEFEGEVTEIGIRSSKMRTWAGAEVIIPNAELISQHVTNLTLSDKKRRIEHLLDVESSADPQVVIDSVKEAIIKQENVLREPEPLVLFQGQVENRLKFRVLYWLSENLLRAKAEVSLNIHQNLKQAGVDFALPESRISLKTEEKISIESINRKSKDKD